MYAPVAIAATPTPASTKLVMRRVCLRPSLPSDADAGVVATAAGGGALARWRSSVSSISLTKPWARWMSSGGSLVPMRRYSLKLARACSS
jgi:hypothetical protein